MKTRKSWREKIDSAPPAKVVPLPKNRMPMFAALPKSAKILIPHPSDVEALIRKVPRGKLVSQTELRGKLARDASADVACPITTGIFVRIVAEAAEEELRAGKSKVAPYWRVVRDDGRLIEKLPGGPSGLAEHLSDEGHEIDRSGKVRVMNVEKALMRYR
jgi:hypothetical protein